MRLVLFTQNDPFFLPDSIGDLLKRLQAKPYHTVVTAIVSVGGPDGKKAGFFKRIHKTYNVFGTAFLLFYSARYLLNRIILRKSVVRVLEKNRIPVWRLVSSINSVDSANRLKELNPDLIVIIAGDQVFKKAVLDIPRYGAINAHSSLLPAYKGLMPAFWVLKNNEKQTGVTVYKLTEGIDDGPIIVDRKFDIDPGLSHSDLVKKCKLVANELILEALDLIDKPDLFRQNKGPDYHKFPVRADVIEFYRNKKRFF